MSAVEFRPFAEAAEEAEMLYDQRRARELSRYLRNRFADTELEPIDDMRVGHTFEVPAPFREPVEEFPSLRSRWTWGALVVAVLATWALCAWLPMGWAS